VGNAWEWCERLARAMRDPRSIHAHRVRERTRATKVSTFL